MRTRGSDGISKLVDGALAGLLLSAAAAGVLYAAARLAGLPFTPFGLFDRLSRLLPGAVLTAGIDAMVGVIQGLGLGPTATVAKGVEQAMAIGLFLLAGAIAGLVLVALLGRARRRERVAIPAGAALGAAAGLLAALVSPAGTGTDVPAWIGAVWTTVAGAAWGGALGWAARRLLVSSHAAAPPASAPPIREPTRERAEEPAPAERIDRRRFLVRLGGATALVTVSGGVVGRLLGPDEQAARAARAGGQAPRPWSATHPLPNADAAVRPVPGTRAELTPVPDHYRIDINTRSPRVDADSWRLGVDGLVERPLSLTLEELRSRDPVHQFVTLECISNRVGGDLISTTRWTGVSLQRLLPELGLRPEATHLVIRSVDGFFECLPLSVPRSDPRVMLCYEWDGLPLPVEHGYPLRIWIPDHFGMKQPKWIESMTATDTWEPGYWVMRGWDKEARVRTTSVIDVIAVDEAAADTDGRETIPVGGIAYAGARGISRVQLRADGGAWEDAEIRRPLADTTWALWRWEWPFAAGEHRIEVRCFDGDGTLQVTEPSPPHPAGATGLDDREFRL